MTFLKETDVRFLHLYVAAFDSIYCELFFVILVICIHLK